MELFKYTHLVKLELLYNATTIDGALNYVRNKQQEQRKKKRLAIDSVTDSNDDDSISISNDDGQPVTSGRQTVF